MREGHAPPRSAPGSAARSRSRSSRPRRTTPLDLAPRGRRRQQRDAPRPAPAALPAERTRSRGRSPGRGRAPSRRAGRCGCRTRRRAGSSSTRVDPGVVHQQPDAGVQRGLGELDGAHVVLGDATARADRRRLVQHVARRSGRRRRRAARARRSAPSIVPSASITPARNSSAMTSMMPEPHTPVMPAVGGAVGEARLVRPRVARRSPGTAARACRGRCAPARSRPASARCPHEICAPSNAGPVGLDAASSRCAVAEHDLGVRADVDERAAPSSPRCGPSARIAAGGVGADVPGDARQDVDAGRRGERAARARGRGRRPARSVASANGAVAERRRVDAEDEVVHDRVADDHEVEDRRRARSPASHRRAARSARRAPSRTAAVISPAPSGFIITYETRLIRSSPKRICGFITPARREHLAVGEVAQVAGDRRRADVDRDAVRACRRSPARRAITSCAVVDGDGDAVPAGGRAPAGAPRARPRSASRSVSPHSRVERVEQPARGRCGRRRELRRRRPRRSAGARPGRRRGRSSVDGPCAPPGGAPGSRAGTSITTSPRIVRARRTSRRVGGQARARRGSRSRRAANGERWPGVEVMPCLANAPNAGSTWQRPQIPRPPQTESRSTPSGAPRRARWCRSAKLAAPARRGEDDERLGLGASRVVGSASALAGDRPAPVDASAARPRRSGSGARWARIQRPQSWSWPTSTSAAMTAAFDLGHAAGS